MNTERVHLHQTSTTRYAKGTPIRRGRKTVREKHKYKWGKMNKYLSIITLNVNGLNVPIKRHKVAEWIRKHDLHISCLQETHLRKKHLHRLKVKGWKKILQANGQERKARVAILISDKTDFRKMAIKRDPERYSILKGRIHQENINIINTHTRNIGPPKYIRKILEDFKKGIESSTLILGDYNNTPSKMDR